MTTCDSIDDSAFDEAPPPFETLAPAARITPAPKPVAKVNGHEPAIVPASIGTAPPHSLEDEEGVLSCCLIDEGETLRKASESLKPEAFIFPPNRIIFTRLLDMQDRKVPIGMDTLCSELTRAKQIEAIGGFPYLIQVSGKSPTTVQANTFIDRVRQLHVLHEVIKMSTDAAARAHDFGGDVVELTAELRSQIDKIDAQASAQAKTYSVWTLDQFTEYVQPPDYGIMQEEAGYPIWSKGVIALLIGAPGIGKSRLAMQLAICQIIGERWCGLDMIKPTRKFLFIGNENSKVRQKRDLAAMTSKLSDKQKDLIRKNLFLHVPGEIHDSILGLENIEAQTRLRATIKAIQPDVLVVDPWQSVIIGGDTNDGAETANTCVMLSQMMLGAGLVPTILIVHHARTGAEAARGAVGYDASSFAKGSKNILGIARVQINVAPGDAEDGSKLVIACGKANDAKRFKTRGVSLDDKTQTYLIDDAFDEKVWTDDIEGKRSGASVSIRDVVECVMDGKHKAGDIVEHLKENLGASARTVTRRIGDAVEKGYLMPTQPRGNYTLGDKKLDEPAATEPEEREDRIANEINHRPYNEG